MREADICPVRAGEGVGVAAKASKSLRIEVDCRRAELNSAFWCILEAV